MGETAPEIVYGPAMSITIFIDADACPVKDETYKVAQRYGLKTFVVANSFMQVPVSPMIERGWRRTPETGRPTSETRL